MMAAQQLGIAANAICTRLWCFDCDITYLQAMLIR
jgi:hypothetical protein